MCVLFEDCTSGVLKSVSTFPPLHSVHLFGPIPTRRFQQKKPREMTEAEKLDSRAASNRRYYGANKGKWKSLPSQSSKTQVSHQKRRKYGVTPEMFDEMFAAQNGACALCGTTNSGSRAFNIDHCHSTQVVRGLLCHNCNVGLGHFRDDPALLMRASEYIYAARTLQ